MKVTNHLGFSLLEILIAMALLAIMMVSIVSISSNSIDTKDQILTEDNEFTQVETAFARITEDFYQIYSPLYFSNKEVVKRTNADEFSMPTSKYTPSEKFPSVSSKGQPIPTIQSPDRQSLIFLSTANRRKFKGLKETNFTWIKYTLRTSEGEKRLDAPFELIRYADTQNIFEPNFKFDDLKPSVLLRNIKSMDFSFWDTSRKKFVDNIPDTLTLEGLQINLTWLDKNKNEKKTNRILIPQWQTPKPPPDEDKEEPPANEELNNENQLEE